MSRGNCLVCEASDISETRPSPGNLTQTAAPLKSPNPGLDPRKHWAAPARCSQSPGNTSSKGDDVKGATSSSGPRRLSCRLKFPSVSVLTEILVSYQSSGELGLFSTCFISGLPVNFNEGCSVIILKLFSKNTVFCQSNQALQGTFCRWNCDSKMK